MSSSSDSNETSLERYNKNSASSNLNVVSLDGCGDIHRVEKGGSREKGVYKSKSGTVARRTSVEALELAKLKCKSYKPLHLGSKHQEETLDSSKG